MIGCYLLFYICVSWIPLGLLLRLNKQKTWLNSGNFHDVLTFHRLDTRVNQLKTIETWIIVVCCWKEKMLLGFFFWSWRIRAETCSQTAAEIASWSCSEVKSSTHEARTTHWNLSVPTQQKTIHTELKTIYIYIIFSLLRIISKKVNNLVTHK